MGKKLAILFLLAILISASLACNLPTALVGNPPVATPAGTPVPKGDRLLGIDVTTSEDGDYKKAFTIARDTGSQVASLTLGWNDLETKPGKYGQDPNLLVVSNQFYPQNHTMINLTIAPIDGSDLYLPSDLTGAALDDPRVISRFESLLDYVFSKIPDLQLSALSLGDDVDVYLGRSQVLCQQFIRFFIETSRHARELRPGLVVGVDGTYRGMLGASRRCFDDINLHTDAVMVSYFPVNDDLTVEDPGVVYRDFQQIINEYPARHIYLMELGYPSSTACNSSEAKQAVFVHEVFKAWDIYAYQIKLLSFSRLTDIPPSSVDYYLGYYGVNGPKFADFVESLGLRTFPSAGTDKQAYVVLKADSKIRGW
jgi:hypothetical protein